MSDSKQVVEQAIAGTGSLDHARWHNSRAIARSRPLSATSSSEKAVAGPKLASLKSNIKTSRTPICRSSRTAVVWPSNLASGTLLYPYAEANET
jgi:hypothetical protein